MILTLALRIVATVALVATALTGSAHPTHALGPRLLTLHDFFDIYPGMVEDVSGKSTATVASIPYAHAIELDRGIAALSYNTHKYAGYTTLSFLVGLSDADGGSQNTLVVTVDGHRYRMITQKQGQPATRIVLPFGASSIIRFSVRGGDPASSGLIIAEPTLLPSTDVPSSGLHCAAASGGNSASTRLLTLHDFFDIYPGMVEDVSGKSTATVASIPYAHAIELDRGIAALSYNTHKYAGYTTLSFLVGLSDADGGSQNTLVVTVDGHVVRTITAPQGHQATKVALSLGASSIIRFSVRGGDPASSGLIIAEPTLHG